MTVEERLLATFADRVVGHVVRRAIRVLRQIKDARLSGDDSRLADAWDEICVQVQLEQSVYWDCYDETARSIVKRELERLPPSDLQAIWLLTDQSFDWRWDREDSWEEAPVVLDDAVDYVTQALYDRAANWSNSRIRDYLERSATLGC